MLAFNFGFTFGFGDDNFASLEPGFGLRLPLHERFRLIGNVGAGLMPESTFSTISLTYFASGGVEVSLSQRTSIRLALRRGSHSNFGDSGTFSGPHLLMVGWAYAFKTLKSLSNNQNVSLQPQSYTNKHGSICQNVLSVKMSTIPGDTSYFVG